MKKAKQLWQSVYRAYRMKQHAAKRASDTMRTLGIQDDTTINTLFAKQMTHNQWAIALNDTHAVIPRPKANEACIYAWTKHHTDTTTKE